MSWLYRYRKGLIRCAVELSALAIIAYWLVSIIDQGRHPSGDGPHAIGTANRLAQLLIDGEFYYFINAFSSLLGPHPPFAYLPFMLAKLVVPEAEWSHLLGGAMILWISWDGIRRIGGGLVGFIWLMCATPVWLQAENAGIDLWAGACVIQSLSHLAASKRLKNSTHVALWGAWMGAAFMTKYTAPLFLWGPTLLAAWWVLRHNRWRPVAYSLAGFSIIALPWWSTHLTNVLGYIRHSGDGSTGLLTNKTMIEDPWGKMENIGWYPAATADAIGWTALIAFAIVMALTATGLNVALRRHLNQSSPKILHVIGGLWRFHDKLAPTRLKSAPAQIVFLSIMGGWVVLNSQKQRQDRYMLPGAPVSAAAMGLTPLAWPALPLALNLFDQTSHIYTRGCPSPSQYDYQHKLSSDGVLQSGLYWQCPAKQCRPAQNIDDKWGASSVWNKGDCPDRSYWPVSLDPKVWGLDEALDKTLLAHGSKTGTVGFLLEEEGGAPGYGPVLLRATQKGLRWNIATVQIARPNGQRNLGANRPLASIFVGPFKLEEYVQVDFDVLLVMTKRKDKQREAWIESMNMTLQETWTLPKNRTARIYIK